MEDRGWRIEILAFVHLQSSILYPQSLCVGASVAKSGLLTSLSPVGPGFSNPQLLEFVLERLPVKPDRRRCLADVSGVTVQYVDQVLSFKRGPGLFVGQLGKFRSASARRTTRRNLGRQVPHVSARRTTRRNLGRQVPHVDGALGAKNDASLYQVSQFPHISGPGIIQQLPERGFCEAAPLDTIFFREVFPEILEKQLDIFSALPQCRDLDGRSEERRVGKECIYLY